MQKTKTGAEVKVFSVTGAKEFEIILEIFKYSSQ